jgi:tRNA-specific 2-thiouridylase
MGFGGGPWFVVKKDVDKNILYVSHGYDPQTAYKQNFSIHDFNYLTPLHEDESLPHRITFKIRHTPDYLPATLETTSEGFIVHADAPIHGVAPGQFCVVYDEQHHRCFGSAEITI